MASKQPLKLFDWKQKLTRWSLRINKTLKHKILSKSRNVLVISSSSNFESMNEDKENLNFDSKLMKMIKKTWEIYPLNLSDKTIDFKDIEDKFKGRQYDAIVVMP